MTNVIVTTTINPPTKAVEMFDRLPGWHLVVIGDRKTPEGYHLDNGTYVRPEEQERIDKELSDLIGWNCIQRRNFGFLLAREMGAEVVAVVDDDNIPLEGWGTEVMVGKPVQVNMFTTSLPAFDPIGATNYPHLWHRGYPLQLLAQRDYSQRSRLEVTPDVQADFWNGDPDIDAICRMQFAPDCSFQDEAFPIASNAIAPFDSQNTFITSSWLENYFLFPGVGRMDDIWAAYYLQAKGAKVVFGKASVTQERNPHNPITDMKLEYGGYENNLQIVSEVAESADSLLQFLPERTVAAFNRYRSLF